MSKYAPRYTVESLEAEVGRRIVLAMETKGTSWVRGWLTDAAARNAITGREYSGRNVFMLSFWMMDNEATDPRFITKKQLRDLGAFPAKGEKGIPIVFYGPGRKDDEEGKSYRFGKVWYVWNVQQTTLDLEDLPAGMDMTGVECMEEEDRIEFVDDWATCHGVPILHRGASAFYSPGQDTIVMPPRGQFFKSHDTQAGERYYGTLLHELIHATGHESRLGRESVSSYASHRPYEELVAEIGSAMLCREFGVSQWPREDNEAYIKGWCKSIADKPAFIMKAAADASAAIRWLHASRNGENHANEHPESESAA